MTHAIELVAADVTVAIDLGHGGRLAQIVVGDQPLLWSDQQPSAIGWGSYPMAPWAGRIRNGRFQFDGRDYQLELNHADAGGAEHAIHGTVYDRIWTLNDATGCSAELQCDLHQQSGGNNGWPFAGLARQRIAVTESEVWCELSVESTGTAFPASIGWHPWFLKPDRLSFTPIAMYQRGEIGLPTAELVEPVPGPWDDTFVNTAPVVLHYDNPNRTRARSVTVTSDCDHWVVYDQPAHATCVEPQSGPPDAPTTKPLLVDPDTPLRRWMRVSWR